MTQTEQVTVDKPRRRRFWRRFAIAAATPVLVVLVGIFLYNNVSLSSDKEFAKRLDAAIEKAVFWVEDHKTEILQKKNAALIRMLLECDNIEPNAILSDVVESFRLGPIRPQCWKALVDPNYRPDQIELNITIKNEIVDNKWVLYALAPDLADITPQQVQMFDPDRWQGRQLTHQLDALAILRRTRGANGVIDSLIKHLCGRLSTELFFDLAVVDIYIQKVTFTLRADHPEKISRRWVERIIADQAPDGGWNDRWVCFTSGRRPRFNPAPPSDQHATIQALTALYLVKYRYPDRFGLK